MKRVLVLGGGLVGSAIARNLSRAESRGLARDDDLAVTVADTNPAVRETLAEKYGLATAAVDVTDLKALTLAARKADLVVGAVPGCLGYRTLEMVIRAGRDVVDISFFPEDPLTLHRLAEEHDVTAVVDAGLAPGLSNLVLGRFHQEYDTLDRFVCYAGGLPKVRKWPFEYQAVFSPLDVIEEYTRPARLKVDGKLVTRPALSDLEQVDLPRLGTLEAFNTDGLRTLLTNIPIPNMQEKTLRYPGHAERMLLLRETGFFNREPLDIDGLQVAPIEVASRLLSAAWQPDPSGSEGAGHDLAVMRLSLSGRLQERQITTVVDLYDEYDIETGTTAMARTTGYTCAAVARLVLDGTFRRPGIQPLELLGADKGVYRRVLSDLAGRGIQLHTSQHADK